MGSRVKVTAGVDRPLAHLHDQRMDVKTGMAPFRLAVIGGGRVTESCHLPALQGLRHELQVVALAEPDDHRRRRVAGMFDIPQVFAEVEALLSDAGDVDAVAVCTPAISHADVALAALAAGKHVLLEKPIALSLDDADRIVEAARQSAVTVTMGFNLRHHRLVQRARAMLLSGAAGQVHLIRTAWTSGTPKAAAQPAWRRRRGSGGGAIAEFAVHHIDLVRYLTGSDVVEACAQCQHGDHDDEVVSLLLRLRNGVTISSAFSERSGDSNELELITDTGRLGFSLYQFDSFRFTPMGGHGGRLGRLVQDVRDLPEAWPVLRRGGDFHETYRRQWSAFAAAVRNRQPPAATVEDGRAALQAVLAAGESANRGVTVAIADAPRSPSPVPRAPEPATVAAVDRADANAPRLSAILTTPGTFETIRRTVRHLHAQTARADLELVIVCSRRDHLALDEGAVAGFWGCQVVEVGEVTSVAAGNAAGTRRARAPIVVFCEDHAFPDPDWAGSLILAHQGPYAVVGPVVRNANPATLVSQADFLIGYGPWAEPMRPCEPGHLPGHNSSYKRDVLLGYGERLAGMLEAESVLHWDLVRAGHRIYLEPEARIAHTNFGKWGIWTSVQFQAGRGFGGARAAGWPIWKRLAFTMASPLIPAVRFARVWPDARRVRAAGSVSRGVVVALVWGLLLDGLGQMVGYALGPGQTRGGAHEFSRVLHITEQDRERLGLG